MFERFADEARRATALASAEARELGHDFIGTEHLLLGLLAAAEGMAFSVLTELEVTVEDARRKVTERVHAYGSGSVDSPPFTPLAKKSLEWGLREALQLKADLIGTEHLLLGLIAVPDGGGARILEELAGNLANVRQAVFARIGQPEPAHADAALEQTKAPVTSKTLRRWATQGLLGHRPPASADAEASEEAEEPESLADPTPLGPPPRCPACDASLATEARYQQLAVPPGRASGTDDELDPGPAITVRFVYCGQCGTAFGIS